MNKKTYVLCILYLVICIISNTVLLILAFRNFDIGLIITMIVVQLIHYIILSILYINFNKKSNAIDISWDKLNDPVIIPSGQKIHYKDKTSLNILDIPVDTIESITIKKCDKMEDK